MFNEWDITLWSYHYKNPWWFLALLMLPIFGYIKYKYSLQKPGFKFNFLAGEKIKYSSPLAGTFQKIQRGLMYFIVALSIILLSEPYLKNKNEDAILDNNLGIDIMIAMDISVSMLARDFKPSRIEVSKKVVNEFIDNRKGDRIGLVAYEGEAVTICPSTLDHELLKYFVTQLKSGKLLPGTAIGVGLGTAVERMSDIKNSTKIVILLTDGVNIQTDITPLEAALLAKKEGVKVYTIGIGSTGTALYPERTQFGTRYVERQVEIDEELMKEIATKTGGKYYRAIDEKSLQAIYNDIDRLEKNEFKSKKYFRSIPVTILPFLNWIALFLGIYFLIQWAYFKANEG